MTEELEKAHAKMAKLEEYVGQLEKDNIWLRKRYEKDQINLANIKREQTMLLASAALRIRF